MVKTILFTFLFVFALVSCNDDDEGQNYFSEELFEGKTFIPDDNFERELIRLGLDDEEDGAVFTNNIKDVLKLNLHGREIKDLTGIKGFTSLEILYCSSNQITDLDISNNTSLRVFICSDNRLTSLDISKNTALSWLDCSNLFIDSQNSLTALDVSQNTLLEQLYCGGLELTDLDLSNNSSLSVLECYSNEITRLDLSNNLELTQLRCENNQLSSLDVSKNTLLEYLYCNENQLTSLKANNGRTLNLNANNNPDLFCIEVFQGIAPSLSWIVDAHDAQFTWSEDCDY